MSNPEGPQDPTFGGILRANLRVLLVVALLAAAAFLLWHGLRLLFPDVAWLQPGKP